ncbi:DUF1080 domain-containing protein [Pyrinomonas sp.]|uniref:3-keto-disaccharide hydrolase n=1 Tax=Pyrinomonas sp. TaxID=2080306 RepID=UPI00332358F0
MMFPFSEVRLIMRLFALLLALLTPFGCQAQKQLFNGKDLDGWQHVGPGRFVVENGVLRTEGGMGLLWYTREKFGDCVIRVVYKTNDPAANSGVFVRLADRPKDEWFAVHHGYEVQILDRQDEYHRTGAIYSLAPSRSVPTRPVGEWNTMEITLQGDLIIVHVNGVEVTRFDPKQPVPPRTKEWEPERDNPRPAFGYIGLQNHDDYVRDKQTHVYFKEVSVRPLKKN